ncbi:MAG: exodeoxyribonuclease VII small subunit [Microthrixaceae bacterium]
MSQTEDRHDQDGVDTGSGGEVIAFAAAMAELTAIVSELESDELDVDVLAERVERAALLVGTCRDRLDATRLKVEEIIVRLDNVEATSAVSTGSAGDDAG